jgi:hypothetical protein
MARSSADPISTAVQKMVSRLGVLAPIVTLLKISLHK